MTLNVALTWLGLARPSPAQAPGSSRLPPPAVLRRAAPSAQHLPVLTYAELIQRAAMQGTDRRVRDSLGLSSASEERDVVPLLQRLAEFVQLLPASESHHHAQPGGLLIHLLEVARYALHFRDAYRLPLGVSPEDQMRHGARYSYAVLVAALLHDIGKPLSDLKVELVTGLESRAWVPMAGSMNEQGGDWYRVDFPEPGTRDYSAHERLPVVLLQRLVPTVSLGWLAQYPPAIHELAAYLSGEATAKDGALAKIVSQADRKSVAENLLGGPRTRFATARAVPLIERLMEGLRRLLAEGGVPLNRAGATGYCDGESLWCVAKTLAEAVRDYLARNEEKQAGAAGIPADNNRLFDTWQEYGALTPTPEGGAIWTVEVTIGNWRQPFTVLRFPLDRLYSGRERYPRALPAGAVRVVDAKAGESIETGAALTTEKAPQQDSTGRVASVDAAVPAVPAAAAAVDSGPEGRADAPDASGTDAPMLLVLPDLVESPDPIAEDARRIQPAPDQPSVREVDFLPEGESAAALVDERGAADVPARLDPVAGQVREPMRPKQKTRRPDRSVAQREGSRQSRPNAERFMAWIQEGVANGALAYNESMARVHFVPEGMLLVTPAIFRDFAQAHPEAIASTTSEDGRTPEPWKQVQRDFQKSGYPVTADSGGAGRSYLIHYNIKGAGGRQLSVMLVPEPERFFNPVPPPNAMIQSKQKPVVQDADDSASA